MNESTLVELHLLVPETSEHRVTDRLLMHPEWQLEFSVHGVAAHGPLVRLAGSEERVQGRASRREIKLVIERARLPLLLGELRSLTRGMDGGWWVMPIEQIGSFDSVAGEHA